MMCDAALWQPQIAHFSQQRSVTVVDFSAADSIAAMADRVLGAMDALGADSRVVLAGLSMGAIVAFEVMRCAPERVHALALLNTNHLADSPERREIRDRQISDARTGKLYWLLRDELKPAYPGESEPPRALLDTVMAMGLRLGTDTFVDQSVALRDRIDSRESLVNITCPTLVLCGAEDTLCPVSRHQEMADLIPTAELVVIPACGHLSTLEQPAQVNSALQSLLKRVDTEAL
jgi:pimeloyl-ACP methyl ester carboxylesterase